MNSRSLRLVGAAVLVATIALGSVVRIRTALSLSTFDTTRAEGMLKSIFENYGRAFKGSVVSRWIAMGVIMFALLALIIIFQKRKDVI